MFIVRVDKLYMSSTARRSVQRILLSVPHMGGAELGYVQQAFASNWMSTVGPNLTALEDGFSRLTGQSCVALSSGTAAIHLALRVAGVGVGDEVVTQSLTFAASANPIVYQGARPVFMDSERSTWNLDPALLADFMKRRAKEGRLPKAVIAVHLFGQPAAIAEIVEICHEYGVFLIEDAAESLGARYRGGHPGTFADIGIFSFNGNKMITGTTGGMLVTRRADWAAKVRHWSTQARDADPAGINNYIHTEIGYNYRMSNVVAGIVRGQLEVLEERVRRRRQIFARYREALVGVPGLEPQPDVADSVGGTQHSRWLSCFLVDPSRFGRTAPELIKWLDSANVESRPVWRPMHVQPVFRGFESIGGAVAEDLNERGICLPSSSSLTDDDQGFVIDAVRAACTG